MKALPTVLTLCCAFLAGCAVSHPDQEQRTAMSRAFDARVIGCALPYLSTNTVPSADIRYRYSNGSVSFQTPDSGLTAHLEQCASPDTGPRAEFEGVIEIWPASAS